MRPSVPFFVQLALRPAIHPLFQCSWLANETPPKLGGCYRSRSCFGHRDGMGAFAMEDDANFTRRIELSP